MKNTHKKQLTILILLSLCVSLMFAGSAFAQGVTIVNSDIEAIENTFVLDADDTGGDITLQFGKTLNKHLQWDDANSYFSFNDDVDFEGNELKNFRIDNLVSAPICDGTADGRLYHNTVNNRSYVCDGTMWQQLDAITGVDNNTFTVDQDDTGGDVNLEFGTTLGEILMWDDSELRFYFSDDVQFDGNLLPSLDDTYSLGTESLRWKNMFIVEGLEVQGGDIHVGEGGFVVNFVNGQSGAGNTITAGNVVKIDTVLADSAILTVSKNDQPIGIAVNDSAYTETVEVALIGKGIVQCTGVVNAGDLIQSSNVDGKAEAGGNATKIVGSSLTTCIGGELEAIIHLE